MYNVIFVHTVQVYVCGACTCIIVCCVCECVPYNCVQSIHFLVVQLTISVHSQFMTF